MSLLGRYLGSRGRVCPGWVEVEPRVLEVDYVLCRQLCWENVTGRRLQQPSVASSFQPVFLSAADAATAKPRMCGSMDFRRTTPRLLPTKQTASGSETDTFSH